MNAYKILNKQIYQLGDFSLVPIRFEDRFDIMNWRNDQIRILRQKKRLTEDEQEEYFNKIIAQLFSTEYPDQLLFSFLKKDTCIGYGGLVHINWNNRNGEISFLLDTELNYEDAYLELYNIYLNLIEDVSSEAGLKKIYTYGYDLLEYRFIPLEKRHYSKEAVLKDHILVEGELRDVRIYGLILN